jgi:hypothetical protein
LEVKEEGGRGSKSFLQELENEEEVSKKGRGRGIK